MVSPTDQLAGSAPVASRQNVRILSELPLLVSWIAVQPAGALKALGSLATTVITRRSPGAVPPGRPNTIEEVSLVVPVVATWLMAAPAHGARAALAASASASASTSGVTKRRAITRLIGRPG